MAHLTLGFFWNLLNEIPIEIQWDRNSNSKYNWDHFETKTSIINNLYVIETKNVSFNGNSTDFFSSENKWYFELVEIDQKPKKIGENGVIRTILKAEKN